MSYSFDILGISSVLNFFNDQQRFEQTPNRSKAYLGSPHCTLDAFIASANRVHHKPEWDWEAVTDTMVDFWLRHADTIQHWKSELEAADQESLIVAQVTNVRALRRELESLFQG